MLCMSETSDQLSLGSSVLISIPLSLINIKIVVIKIPDALIFSIKFYVLIIKILRLLIYYLLIYSALCILIATILFLIIDIDRV